MLAGLQQDGLALGIIGCNLDEFSACCLSDAELAVKALGPTTSGPLTP